MGEKDEEEKCCRVIGGWESEQQARLDQTFSVFLTPHLSLCVCMCPSECPLSPVRQ